MQLIADADRLYVHRAGQRPIPVAAIDPAAAAAYLELVGHSSAVALLVAHGALDTAAARRLGVQVGLLEDVPCDR